MIHADPWHLYSILRLTQIPQLHTRLARVSTAVPWVYAFAAGEPGEEGSYPNFRILVRFVIGTAR